MNISIKKLFYREPSLNEKINQFIIKYKNKPIPLRESVFKPEILIPCYNHGRYLPGLVNNVYEKKLPITIINDNSNDHTEDVIMNLQQTYEFKYIKNSETLLQSGSLNRAIAESDNNMFIVVNADDFLVPKWIDYAVKSFEFSDIRMFGGTNVSFKNVFFETELFVSEMIKSITYLPASPFKVFGPDDAVHFGTDNAIDMTMSGCTFLKSAWEFVDGFYCRNSRVSIHDDRDFQMRVCSFFNIGISSEICAFWRSDSSHGMGVL